MRGSIRLGAIGAKRSGISIGMRFMLDAGVGNFESLSTTAKRSVRVGKRRPPKLLKIGEM